jgi:hypothetical protein
VRNKKKILFIKMNSLTAGYIAFQTLPHFVLQGDYQLFLYEMDQPIRPTQVVIRNPQLYMDDDGLVLDELIRDGAPMLRCLSFDDIRHLAKATFDCSTLSGQFGVYYGFQLMRIA